MSFLTVSRAGLAGAGFALALTTFASAAPAVPRTKPVHSRPSIERRRHVTPLAGCTTNYATYSFIGIGGANEVAGGDEAAVLGGYGNEACDADDGIGGGYLNVIGNDGNADWSSIGGGQSNGISAPNSFVGSGTANVVSGLGFSVIGGGSSNGVSGEYAFDGAGLVNQVSGDGAAVVSGTENSASGLYSFVGGGKNNTASNIFSVVAGGVLNVSSGWYSFSGGGSRNTASANNSVTVGGYQNVASGIASFIGSGEDDGATGGGSFVGGGDYTYATACACSTFGNLASGTDAFIGAGDQNTVSASDAFVGAGALNSITSTANYSTIAGGYGNTMSGQKAALGGGEQNEVTGSFATIPGGYHDEAIGNESFAAGSQAEARYTGSFVWSDYVSGEKPLGDSAADEFVARASGGVYFFSNAAASSGVHLAAGSGSWSSLSDRNAKTDIVPLDDASILEKVASLPIDAWQYKTEHGVRHVGPMAQDFYAAFGVGEDDRHITSIDEDGVALASIKALHSENRELYRENHDLRLDSDRKANEIDRLRAGVALLTARDAIVERRLDTLSARLQSSRR